MQAANEGALAQGAGERAQSVGIRVDLPFEHQTFFSRLHHFVLLSDAYVVVPGGIGTVLEATLVWQLLQVRHLHDTPLIFVGDMWAELVDWARRYMLRPGLELASPEDMAIPRCVKTADEAIAIIKRQHARWQDPVARPSGEAQGIEPTP